jgi:tetratricopeptide (TPR) repeat protein
MKPIHMLAFMTGITLLAPARAGATDAATALTRGDYAAALHAADEALQSNPNDFFSLYCKGSAEAGLGHIDDAVVTLRRAQSIAPDGHWRGLTIYRRAIGLQQAGRCSEAVPEFQAYADEIRPEDPDGAALAERYSAACPAGAQRQKVSGRDR